MFTSFQEKSAQLSKGITVSNVFKVVCDYFPGQLIVACLEISYTLQSSSNALGSILVSYTVTQCTEPSGDWQRVQYFTALAEIIQELLVHLVLLILITEQNMTTLIRKTSLFDGKIFARLTLLS